MGYSSLFCLGFCFLVFFHGCVAQIEEQSRRPKPQREQRWQRDECQLNRINAVEPSRRFRSEAGETEIWDENDDQFQCVGVVAMRHRIEQRGLLLPQYVNGPKLIYVVQGRGLHGAIFPGCPETYQSPPELQPQRSTGPGQEFRQGDHHQKVRYIREGDIIALPEGVAHWIYNNGRTPLVLVQIIDTSNSNNQLDQNHRDFFLAGNPQREVQSQRGRFSWRTSREFDPGHSRGGQDSSRNIFSGLDERIIAEAFNINTDLARRIRGENDYRGIIVSVEHDLDLVAPERSQEEEREAREEEAQRHLERSPGGRYNGLEETYCTVKLRHNINNPSDSDIFNPRAGRITTINKYNLPMLRYLQLSAEKAVLYRNAIVTPHWTTNAHSIRYVTRGSGRVQIVNDRGESVFDGQVQEGQIFTIPQNFVVITKASNKGLEWVSFKTHENAKISQLAGRVSAIKSMPEEVVAHAFQVSLEDARRLKDNRNEVTVLSPVSRSQY